jgi:hypothetical protein
MSHSLNSIGHNWPQDDPSGWGNRLHCWLRETVQLYLGCGYREGWSVTARSCNQFTRGSERVKNSLRKQSNKLLIFSWVFSYHPCLRSLTDYKYKLSFPASLGQASESTNGFSSLFVPGPMSMHITSTAWWVSQTARCHRRTQNTKPRMLHKFSLNGSVTSIKMNTSWNSANYEDLILLSNAIPGSDCSCLLSSQVSLSLQRQNWIQIK